MFFIFDTETNGIGRNNHCLSIGWIIADKDMKVQETGYKLFCRPDLKRHDWNPNAQEKHGITWRKSQNEGLDPTFEWPKILKKMDGKYLVAHNMKFDWGVVHSDIERFGLETPNPIGKICTLETARNIWPRRGNKLPEVFNRLYLGKDFYKIFKHHDAMDDTRACANIFAKLKEKGVYQTILK